MDICLLCLTSIKGLEGDIYKEINLTLNKAPPISIPFILQLFTLYLCIF